MSTGELVKPEENITEVVSTMGTAGDNLACLLNPAVFNHIWRVATAYSRSMLVPTHFRGKPDDCFVACQLAMRLQVDPFMLMQRMYVVNGKPGMEAQLAIALTNARGVFRDRIRWKFDGEGMDRQCTAFAHDRVTGELLEQTVTMKVAKAEGWIDKAGSKWKTMPDMMLQYRSASWLVRTACPEVLAGLYTVDELRDVIDVDYEPAKNSPSLDALAGPKTEAATVEPPKDIEPQDSPAPERVPEEFRDQARIIEDYRDAFAQAETVEQVDQYAKAIESEPGTTTRTVGLVLAAAKKRRAQLEAK